MAADRMERPTHRRIGGYSASGARRCLLLFCASVAAGCGGPQSDNVQTRLSGDVTYGEQAALPAGATVELRLDDTTAAGSPPLARQTIEPQTRESPIPFSLSFPRSALEEKHRYVLRASIVAPSGEVLFTTPPDQRPLENPNTTGRIELALVRAAGAPQAPR
jgi:uncharacterized lipoprotein YbaY